MCWNRSRGRRASGHRRRGEGRLDLSIAEGTPFISLFTPPEMLALAREVGFRAVRHFSPTSLAERYFARRSDGLRPSSGEDLLVATT